jgi:iron(III) transport system permease protein
MRPLRIAMWAALAALLAAPAIYLAIAVAAADSSATAVLASGATWIAVARTLALGLGAATACVAIALPLAWLTAATDLPGRRVFAVLLNLPLAVPSYVGAFVVVALLAPGGSLAGAWSALGLGEIYGGAGATLALLFSYPLALLPLQAALSRIDPRLFESARSLGASPTRAFFRAVLPQLRPAMGTGAILVGLYAVGDFGAVSLLRYKSLSYLIYVRYKSLFDRDEAAVLGLLLIAVATLLVLILLWARGRVAQSLSWAGERRRWPAVALGGWRWPAFALCSAVATAGLGVPLYVVASWIARGLNLGHSIAVPWAAIRHSIELAAMAAALLTASALVPALIARYGRSPSGRARRGGRWLSAITHIGYALPGIVVALALVSLTARHLTPLYQTVTLLVAAYVLRFFPLALHSTDDGIAGHNRGLFWAARSLGAGPMSACWRVVIPNARPALAAAFLASFVAVLKELPLTLLLSPPGYETLATRIWMLTEDAYFFEVAPAVLALLVVAAAAMLFAPRRLGPVPWRW